MKTKSQLAALSSRMFKTGKFSQGASWWKNRPVEGDEIGGDTWVERHWNTHGYESTYTLDEK